MHSILTTPCLASVEEYLPLIGIFIPIIMFFIGLIIVLASFYYKNQDRKLWHETARLALEKGQPIPASIEVISTKKPEPTSPHRDVKAGLILLAVTAGMFFSKDGLNLPEAGVFIPGFIGLALLLNALFIHLTGKNSKVENPTSLPPKA